MSDIPTRAVDLPVATVIVSTGVSALMYTYTKIRDNRWNVSNSRWPLPDSEIDKLLDNGQAVVVRMGRGR